MLFSQRSWVCCVTNICWNVANSAMQGLLRKPAAHSFPSLLCWVRIINRMIAEVVQDVNKPWTTYMRMATSLTLWYAELAGGVAAVCFWPSPANQTDWLFNQAMICSIQVMEGNKREVSCWPCPRFHSRHKAPFLSCHAICIHQVLLLMTILAQCAQLLCVLHVLMAHFCK